MLKRHKVSRNFNTSEYMKKNGHTVESATHDSFLTFSGNVSEVVQKQPSIYDGLLMTLQSNKKSLINSYKKRQREEANSDPEDLGSSSKEEDSGEDGSDGEILRSHELESKIQKPSMIGNEPKNEEIESEDDQETSGANQEYSMGVNAQIYTSSFHIHLGYNLSEEEVQNLSNRKWEYKWEVPATDKLNWKWVGTGECFLKGVDENFSYGLKERLYKHWLDNYTKSGGNDFYSSKQRFFFSLCNSYRDILHCNKKPFYLKGIEEDSSIKDAYIIHSLNHVFFSRDLLKKNDSKMAKHQEGAQDELLVVDDFLDRGFTRPKVLILLPFRSIALRVVKRLIQLTPQAYKVNVEYVDRFYDEFGTQEDEDNVDVDKFPHYIGNSKSLKSSKPSDHQALFGGNNDDNFMIGIKFTRRSIKLYSDFYSSDMIVASPLALHAKIEEAIGRKEKDFDFLSSIEVLVIDHADVIALQNWNSLTNVLEHLNLIPSKQHGTDIMRIRKWYLDEHARYYRQTIILGHYINPDVNASFNHQCVNYRGKVKSVCKHKGILSKIEHQVRQIYERFSVDSIADADDSRHEYFAKKFGAGDDSNSSVASEESFWTELYDGRPPGVLLHYVIELLNIYSNNLGLDVFPKINDSTQGGIMLFVSSYFEYVKLRNYLKAQDASFCALADYTKPSDVSRARLWFFEGKKKIMLYTERRHFYDRYKIRGIKHLIIYSLPDRMDFYHEMINMLEGDDNMTCTVLFSKFDQFRLERIVGSAHARRMMTSEKNVFLFC